MPEIEVHQMEMPPFVLRCGRRVRRVLGHRWDQWIRVVQIDDWRRFLLHLPASQADALEISPSNVSLWKNIGFRSYTSVQFPEFDITKQALDQTFDVIIAEQVFEHLKDPYSAACNVRKMLKDDGVFLIATPFLIKVHNYPGDYTRWTPEGMQAFLEICGFDSDVKAWGNQKAAIANFRDWVHYGYGWRSSMKNEPEFPLTVWAYARKRQVAAALA